MTPLACLLLVGLHGPALAHDDPDAARRELEEVRAELVELQQALDAAQVRREAEVERLRAEVQRLERRLAHANAPRVGYGEPVVVPADAVAREAVAFGEDVEVLGLVEGDATSFGGDVRVQEGGVVRGNAISLGGEVEVAEGGRVEGVTISLPLSGPGVASAPSARPVDAAGSIGPVAGLPSLERLTRRLVGLLTFAGLGVLVVGLFPHRVTRIAAAVEEAPVRSMALGVVGASFLLLFSILVAVFTLGLGLPVSFAIWALLAVAWLFGFVGICQAVGDRLPFEHAPNGRWVAFLVGVLLVGLVGSLPVVGVLVVAGASALAVGAALSTRLGGR